MARKKGEGSPDDVKRRFGDRLLALRGTQTQKAFAQRFGQEEATYGRWERGETEPSIDVLTKMYYELNVSLDYIVAGDLKPLGGGSKTDPRAEHSVIPIAARKRTKQDSGE